MKVRPKLVTVKIEDSEYFLLHSTKDKNFRPV